MKTENWKQVKAAIEEVINLEPAGRKDFLDAAHLNAEVRQEVESLLAFEAEAEDLMQLPAIEFSKSFFDDDENAANVLIGQNIGAFRIVGELGHGGMGAVYLAERADGKFAQKVALKLLKREMNTATLRRRFQRERAILASLEHPNIARLLDAGTTDDKIPFLAMEYVDGLPIDVYCRRQDSDLNERLELFRKVCAAVNFAHRSLVVHRDLKPSNILVTADGTPKLLDFGISKFVSDELDDNGAATVTKFGAMTPAYASPEQLRGESVSTATDVYSLGVILFELLSGHRPFEQQENNLREMFKAVNEIDPPPPSALVQTNPKSSRSTTNPPTDFAEMSETPTEILAFDKNTKPHQARQTIQPKINLNSGRLRGDLDNIVLKALRKETERRYSSAENFAEDVRRHLAGLPVTARPNTFSYRAEKFVKRNRAGVFAGALILLAIIGGLAATLWQARIAQRERIKAEKRFNDVRTLANSFLFEFSPKIENLPGSMPARQLLVTRALEYLDNLSQESAGDLRLQGELAKAYEKVGDVQGNPDLPNIGDLKGALQSYEKAQITRRKLLEDEPNNADRQSDLANNLEVTANINLNGGEFAKAGGNLAEAVALREKAAAQKPQDFAARSNLAKTLRTSGFVPFYDGESEKAIEFFRRSMTLFAELNKEFPDDAFVGYQYANTFIDVGESFGHLDDIKQAEENIQRGLDLLSVEYEKHPNDNRIRRSLMLAHLKRGEYYRDGGDLANSLIRYDRALELAQNALKIDSTSFQAKRDVVIVNKQRAVTLKAAERFKESLESFAAAIEISEQLKKEDPNNIIIVYDIAGAYHEMSELYYLLKDYPATLAAAEKALDNCREVLAKNPEHTQSKRVTAWSKIVTGKVYEALAAKNGQTETWRKALENYRASLEIYEKFKTEGKLVAVDNKKLADLEASINRVKSKLGES